MIFFARIAKLVRLLFRVLGNAIADCVGFIILFRSALKARRDSRKPRTKPRLVWGPIPLINNKYWSRALQRAGFESHTLMDNFYSVYRKEDFDHYIEDIVSIHFLRRIKFLWPRIRPFITMVHVLDRYDVFHHHFTGGFFNHPLFWRIEAPLLHFAGKKIVITAFGSDAYSYKHVTDLSLRQALLMSYPAGGRGEAKVRRNIEYWTIHADAVIPGAATDGIGRWDVLPVSLLTIDTNEWIPKRHYSDADGLSAPVKVLHSPNHRGYKGTEFILDAIRQLQDEGLQIELVLAENVKNQEIKKLMQEVDILAEQIVVNAYALSAIEGMASGLPVISNLEETPLTLLWRRYSYLSECPIASARIETLKDTLRTLIRNPDLRRELGQLGRLYAEKYHSDITAAYIFGSIYEKLWFGRAVGLLDLFHPLKSTFVQENPVSRGNLRAGASENADV